MLPMTVAVDARCRQCPSLPLLVATAAGCRHCPLPPMLVAAACCHQCSLPLLVDTDAHCSCCPLPPLPPPKAPLANCCVRQHKLMPTLPLSFNKGETMGRDCSWKRWVLRVTGGGVGMKHFISSHYEFRVAKNSIKYALCTNHHPPKNVGQVIYEYGDCKKGTIFFKLPTC